MANSVKILNYALDESPLRGGSIILRGVIDPDSLKALKTDDYQREVLPQSPRHPLMKAIKAGEPLPDVELGTRGQNYLERNDALFLHDDVYIIDGLQRISAAIRHHSLTGQSVRLGCVVHFDTTREWERDRFDVLNTTGVRVSPNILLRNHRETSPAMALLYEMSDEDTRFALHKRVSWKQNMARADLITAMMLSRVVHRLHRHLGFGAHEMSSKDLVPSLDSLVLTVGHQNIRMNTRAFFDLIDECWGIKLIQYRDTASQLKGTFMIVLAKLLSSHTDFWTTSDKKLIIPTDLRRKFAQFPVSDPTVVNLASAGGRAQHLLMDMLKEHLDKGKKVNRLTLRSTLPVDEVKTYATGSTIERGLEQ